MPLAGGLTAVSKGRTVFVVATDGAAAYGIGEALGTAPGVDAITAGDGTPEALAALAAAVPDAALVVIGNGPEPTASGYTWDQPRPAPITGDQDSPFGRRPTLSRRPRSEYRPRRLIRRTLR